MKTLLQLAAALILVSAAAAPAKTPARPEAAKAARPAAVKTPEPTKAAPKAAKTPKAPAAPKTFKPPKAPKPRPAVASYIGSVFAAMQGGFVPARNSGGVLFQSGGSLLRVLPEKRYCLVNGIRVYQCLPTKYRNGGVQVSRLDAIKTFAPLSARRIGVCRHRLAVITIDPGHGGRDRGAAGRVLREKEVTLQLAFRVAAILRRCGYRVHLTRSRDTYVPLPDRCLLQRRHGSDIFVSIHVNAAAGRELQGIEVFALTPAGAASTSAGAPSHNVFGGNLFDANNMLLAYQIHGSLLRRTGAVDRGVKRARFAVLRDISVPGVLVEVGFISNPREERLLLDPVYREKIARGIAEGIIVYHRSLLPPRPKRGNK